MNLVYSLDGLLTIITFSFVSVFYANLLTTLSIDHLASKEMNNKATIYINGSSYRVNYCLFINTIITDVRICNTALI